MDEWVPQTMLFKRLDNDLLSEFHVVDSLSIDLQAIPVNYRPESFNGFFKLVLHII